MHKRTEERKLFKDAPRAIDGKMFAEWDKRSKEVSINPVKDGELFQVGCCNQWMRKMTGFLPGIGERRLFK